MSQSRTSSARGHDTLHSRGVPCVEDGLLECRTEASHRAIDDAVHRIIELPRHEERHRGDDEELEGLLAD